MLQRWQVRCDISGNYPVIQAPFLFDQHHKHLLEFGRPGPCRRFVVIDNKVNHYYGERIRNYFSAHQIQAKFFIISGQEHNKNIQVYQKMVEALDRFPIHRRDEPIIIIGGGVVTDLAAFVAATYRRGLPHIKIPTTLMGHIDAALGVKNGINYHQHKNRLGAFTPPQAVLLDASFLATLPKRHLINGLCEIIKLAIIADNKLFTQLEQQGRRALDYQFSDAKSQQLLAQATGSMLDELGSNLFEKELARAVDFGHSFSYGLELKHPELLHGEAVLLDILISCELAYQRGRLQKGDYERVLDLIKTLDLQPQLDALDTDTMWQALQDRIEHRNGRQHLPIPTTIGTCEYIEDLSYSQLDQAHRQLVGYSVFEDAYDPAT